MPVRWYEGSYLQHQDEVFYRLVPLEQEVLLCSLVLLIELELLDNTGMFDQPQQDLLRDIRRFEWFHLCWREERHSEKLLLSPHLPLAL